MPVLYHGTKRVFAIAMAATPGTIDVTRGRGEFGRGFYTQDSIGNASRRGYLLYGNTGSMLVLTIDDHAYRRLNFKRLSLNSAQNDECETSRSQHPTRIYHGTRCHCRTARESADY